METSLPTPDNCQGQTVNLPGRVPFTIHQICYVFDVAVADLQKGI